MTVFGRRVAPTSLLSTLVLLMSIATSQASEPIAACRYNETEWSHFGEGEKDVCNIAHTLMNDTCQAYIPSLGITSHTPSLRSIWYTASRFTEEEFPKTAKRCACSRVMFNLLSACAGCQKWEWSKVKAGNITWQTFNTYQDEICSGSDIDTSDLEKRAIVWNPLPPAWATTFGGDTFDPTGAQPAAPETTSASPSSTSPAAETSPAITDNAAPLISTSSGPAIGAIVGGVIGGLVLLGAIAGLTYWLYCRKRRARDVAPSSEFLKREYFMEQPPLLPAHERRDSAYRDEVEEEAGPSPTHRRSWVGGFAATRRQEEDEDDCEMLPPFTRGTYIGPSPHEKGYPERRDTGDTDLTVRTENTTTFFLSSASPTKASPTKRPGPSDYYP